MKHLVTVGCSFSDIMRCDGQLWPTFLSKELNHNLHSHGKSGMGNYYISTTTIQEVQELLNEGIDEKDILVGVQWSGVLRRDIFENLEWKPDPRRQMVEMNFFLSLPFLDRILNNTLLKKVDLNLIDYYVRTLQAILLTQCYLESKNIKYFMFSMNEIFISDILENSYLHNLSLQINRNKWLPCKGMFEWCFNKLPDPKDMHPSSEQNLEFTKQVIIPWLKENYDCF